MALDSPEAYVRLGEHLKEIDPIFQAFLDSSGFADNTGALGRYPHRSAVRHTEISRKLDLQMEDDSDGERFSEFERSIPYSLRAGAWVDMNGKRYCGDQRKMIFEHVPYVEMVPRLAEALIEGADYLNSVSKEEIVSGSEPFDLPTMSEQDDAPNP